MVLACERRLCQQPKPGNLFHNGGQSLDSIGESGFEKSTLFIRGGCRRQGGTEIGGEFWTAVTAENLAKTSPKTSPKIWLKF